MSLTCKISERKKNQKETEVLVTIFCITFNHGLFIREAIEGFLMQETDFPVKIFIHDDASKDNTSNIIDEYKHKYPDLFEVIISTDNKLARYGSQYFFNLLDKQTSLYIAFCEGDDYWIDKNKLQKQVDYLKSNTDCIACIHDAIVVNHDGNVVKELNCDESMSKYSQHDCISYLISNYPTSSLLFQRSALYPAPNYLKRCMYDATIDVAITRYGFLGIIHEKMSAYRVHNGGIFTSATKLQRAVLHLNIYSEYARCKTLEKYYDIIEEKITYFRKLILDSERELIDKIDSMEKSYSWKITAFIRKSDQIILKIKDQFIYLKKILSRSIFRFYIPNIEVKIPILFFYKYLFILIDKTYTRLPDSFHKKLYSNLHQYIHCRDSQKSNYLKTPLDKKYISLNSNRLQGVRVYEKKVCDNKFEKLNNAYVTSEGIIIEDGAINCRSSLYKTINIFKILKSAFLYFNNKQCQSIDEAVFLPRQYVDKGTYGDYFTEILINLCAEDTYPAKTILVDSEYINKFCSEDFSKIGFSKVLLIPQEGILVRNLHVLMPYQYFDNYTAYALKKTVEKFPIPRNTTKKKKIYLSRNELPQNINIKQTRKVKNEKDLEEFLKSKGFEILYTHNYNNEEIRILISDAEVIVGNHGAAFVHIAWSKPRVLIEIATEEWWSPFYAKLSQALKIPSYIMIETKNGVVDLNLVDQALAMECH